MLDVLELLEHPDCSTNESSGPDNGFADYHIPELNIDDFIGNEPINEKISYIKIALLASRIGIPFCVETNPYYKSPHSVIHDLGHWAVKPNSYIGVYRSLSAREFKIVGTYIVGASSYGFRDDRFYLSMYPSENDRIPDWDMPDGLDPTAGERTTRAWAISTLAILGIKHPFDNSHSNYNYSGLGDALPGKGSSFRTWNPSIKNHPEVLRDLKYTGMDPDRNILRPRDIPLPFTHPSNILEMIKNINALTESSQLPTIVYPGQMEEYSNHLARKFGWQN